MGLFKRCRAKRAARKQLKNEERQKVVAEEKMIEKKAQVSKSPVKPEQKNVQTKKEQLVKKEALVEDGKKEENQAFRYHVSQNKDKSSAYFKQWRVRRSSSKKTIKYFNTQKEAIDYAEELAKNNDTTVVIHKLDGSIRKQNY